MPFYYLAFICFIVFFSKGIYKIILITIYLVNIIFLFTFEYYNPDCITPYANREKQFEIMVIAFFFMVALVIFMVNTAKRLYMKEKKYVADLIEEYRRSSEILRNELNSKMLHLSLRERDVFKFIIEGKTNKEIAEILCIELGTVKIHINKIYKKLGTKNRKETINHMIKNKQL